MSIDGFHLEPDSTFVLPWRIENKLEEFRKRMGLCPQQMKVLDYGCGSGKSVLWLLERGYDAYGVDISPEGIRNAAELLSSTGTKASPCYGGSNQYAPSWDGWF